MIFATDIDGTVLRDDGTPHPETKKAFKLAREKGHKIVLSTGRSLSRVWDVVNLIGEIDYLVCNNGALVHDIQSKKDLDLKFISPLLLEEQIKFAKKENIIFTLHTNNQAYNWPDKRYADGIFLNDELIDNFINFIKSNPKTNSLHTGEYITQLSFLAPEDFCDKHFPIMAEKYKDKQQVYLTNSIFLDINPLNTSKWTGLVTLANSIGIKENEIVTFGDSGNDYEMLKNAKENGHVLANAKKDLTIKLKPNIGNNNSDAIAKVVYSKIL